MKFDIIWDELGKEICKKSEIKFMNCNEFKLENIK